MLYRRRTKNSRSLDTVTASNLLFEQSKSAFLRAYSHGVRDYKAFEGSFLDLQVARKRLNLGREMSRNGSTVVYHVRRQG